MVDINLFLNNLALYTERTLISSWFVFIGGLLGSVFGILGLYAYFMCVVEGFTEKIKDKYERKKGFDEINSHRKKILGLFEKESRKKKKN